MLHRKPKRPGNTKNFHLIQHFFYRLLFLPWKILRCSYQHTIQEGFKILDLLIAHYLSYLFYLLPNHIFSYTCFQFLLIKYLLAIKVPFSSLSVYRITVVSQKFHLPDILTNFLGAEDICLFRWLLSSNLTVLQNSSVRTFNHSQYHAVVKVMVCQSLIWWHAQCTTSYMKAWL